MTVVAGQRSPCRTSGQFVGDFPRALGAYGTLTSVDPVTLLTIASSTASLLKSMGVIKSSADRIAAETAQDVRALMRNDFNAGLSNLEIAAHTDFAHERADAIARALGHLRVAQAQEGLPRHITGLAGGILASFAVRDGDRGGARLWATKAVSHYDAAFRGLDRAAQRSVRIMRVAPTWGRAGVLGGAAGGGAASAAAAAAGLAVLGPVVPLLAAPAAARALAGNASKAVPSDDWLGELGLQAQSVHTVARHLDLDPTGSAVGVRVVRQGGAITESAVILA